MPLPSLRRRLAAAAVWLVVALTAAVAPSITVRASDPAPLPAVAQPAAVQPAAQQPAVQPDAAQSAELRFGWAGERAAEAARAKLGAAIVPYGATDREYQAVADKRIGLWVPMQVLHDGEHLHNIPQQVGDCVSWGFGHACEYSLAVHWAVSGGEDRVFREVFKPYLYGAGRVLIAGGRLGGDGSTGAWQSRAIEEYGVLPIDAEGCPDYSGQVARKWGAQPGPPAKFIEIAKRFRGECKLVTTWEDACVAISNGAPVAVCSGYGFKVAERNGRIEAYRSGSWPHCMCFIGCDTRRGMEALYCLNSWGANAHAKAERYKALDDAPPGGMWVLKRDAEGMLSARDSYSVDFAGFGAELNRVERAEQLFGWINAHEAQHAGDDHAQATSWLTYTDAKAEAERKQLALIVLIDVDDATRSRVEAQLDARRAVLCTATPAEAAKFSGPGVYRYRFQGGRLMGGRDSISQ